MDAEVSAPTWFSSVQIFLIGALLLLSAVGRRRIRIAPGWLILGGLGFVFASADEGAAIHEKIGAVVYGLDMTWLLFEGDRGGWVIPYLVVGAVILLAARHAIAQLWRDHRGAVVAFAVGATIFLLGAVGLEVLSYEYLRSGAAPELVYQLEVAAEEFFELCGTSVMVYGALRLVSDRSAPAAG